MAVSRKVVEHLGSPLGADSVEVDKHIVEHHRQLDATAGKVGDQGKPHAEEQLLASAAAEDVDRQRFARQRFRQAKYRRPAASKSGCTLRR